MFCLEAVEYGHGAEYGRGPNFDKIGATLKAMMRQEQQSWLEDPATLSPSQSCCHGLLFASLMLHSALLFGHPPNLAVMFMVCNSDAFTVH